MGEDLLEENADVLADLAARGVDLARTRQVDFTAVFASEAAADRFAAVAAAEGFSGKVERSGCVEALPWDVVVCCEMVPSTEAVTGAEIRLGILAAAEGGRTDGWGFPG
ncbi:ribonuclease E inhibitor RraB [Caulobacter sp. 602-2]|uniref:Ribonuclease E inhibitor RraB n=1 Tax=Caulobacter sp. 602-2 TaxID=2710887 RepID=A0A6G4R223_9CAUL|nr:ribonuclease E inhibitor RraB [Caulobacter sp. 602-2]NGM51831.1 ribonuclease E inhibitor RraB [Caulobacter sp. 602-2]